MALPFSEYGEDASDGAKIAGLPSMVIWNEKGEPIDCKIKIVYKIAVAWSIHRILPSDLLHYLREETAGETSSCKKMESRNEYSYFHY